MGSDVQARVLHFRAGQEVLAQERWPPLAVGPLQRLALWRDRVGGPVRRLQQSRLQAQGGAPAAGGAVGSSDPDAYLGGFP
uniref:hypothetical protein n=1 Tax=Streptomyces geranii TaxID=2058923 RepID=UPI001E526F41|nr:hypothetical protein [Streptomyces geranii]